MSWPRILGMDFAGDAFISYAHLDNVELVEGRKGWVANFHRALEVRVGQLLGKSPKIWRDPKLSGNDLFEETLVDQLKQVALLVSVVSPRYLKSEWTIRELNEFRRAAEEQGGIMSAIRPGLLCSRRRCRSIAHRPSCEPSSATSSQSRS